MEYDEMMFLANMRRKAKVEFENNLWKRRFEELNGFPMEEGLFKENIIMPFSENDYLKNKILDKATELMDNKGNSEEFEIQRTDYQRTDNRFSGYQKECEDYLETNNEDIQFIIRISKNSSEEERRRVEFYKNCIIRQGCKNVTVEEVDDVTE